MQLLHELAIFISKDFYEPVQILHDGDLKLIVVCHQKNKFLHQSAVVICVFRRLHLFENFSTVQSVTQFPMARSMTFIPTTIGSAKAFVAFRTSAGKLQASVPHTSNWRLERTKEGINLSHSFAVNEVATNCNLTTHSLL